MWYLNLFQDETPILEMTLKQKTINKAFQRIIDLLKTYWKYLHENYMHIQKEHELHSTSMQLR